ncbi:kinase-like domain-containing protein [Epithele typhae]|uniref:kinase-like domain-containing protein n=1 Tax=Epithele typhae TaxID=378194 RepID=UPI0020078F5C|nr:kinase-like domain-containing protein [Epithele typhae]KAH9921977.1 kinase-like domain-containing protein [Epithele typhae]
MASASKLLPMLESGTILRDRYCITTRFGSGSFGAVYGAEHTTDREETKFAVKVIGIPRGEDGQLKLKRIHAELNNHSRVSDVSNVINVYETWVDLDVGYCQDKGVYHRDLKPENILVNANGTEVYLTDFGLSTTIDVTREHGRGTRSHMSPECHGRLTNFAPYPAKPEEEDRDFKEFLECPSAYLLDYLPITEELHDILLWILEIDPDQRPTLTQLRTAILRVEQFYDPDHDLSDENRPDSGESDSPTSASSSRSLHHFPPPFPEYVTPSPRHLPAPFSARASRRSSRPPPPSPEYASPSPRHRPAPFQGPVETAASLTPREHQPFITHVNLQQFGQGERRRKDTKDKMTWQQKMMFAGTIGRRKF